MRRHWRRPTPAALVAGGATLEGGESGTEVPDVYMGVFERMQQDGHEQVVFCYDKATGLKTIIAIHDTTLGPALGGCRMWPYETEEEALDAALRLSKGMTYKSAASGQNHGGGKAVIWGNPQTDKSEEYFRAFGRFVQTLGGRFSTGTDVGTTPGDFVFSKMESPWLVGLPEEHGGSGNTAIITAFGVWKGIKAAAAHVWGDDSLKGKRIAVSGLGKVGFAVCEHLHDEGAILTVTDIDPAKVQKARETFGCEGVSPEQIFDVECDIFSPNALGGSVNESTLPRLKCRIIAGSENNQLKEERFGAELHRRRILYAPDYVINAGGLIQVADEYMGYNRDRAYRKTAAIYDLLRQIFAISRDEDVPTNVAANRFAERRIAKIGQVNRIYVPE